MNELFKANKNQLIPMQQMDIDGWSQESNNYKTIVSESETRNQTTNKKKDHSSEKRDKYNDQKYLRSKMNRSENKDYYYHPKHTNYRRTSRSIDVKNMSTQQLNSKIQSLQFKKQNLILTKKYSKIAKIQSKLEYCYKIMKEKQIEGFKEQHIIEQNQLYRAHLDEMKQFKQTWNKIFKKYDKKQYIVAHNMAQEQERDVRLVSQNFKANINSENRKYFNRSLHIQKQWKNIEHSLLECERFHILSGMNIDKQIKKSKRQIQRDHSVKLQCMRKNEEKKLAEKYEKKYSSRLLKTKQQKETQMKIYKRNKEIVKQKFLNALKRMKHKQVKELQELQKQIDINNCKKHKSFF